MCLVADGLETVAHVVAIESVEMAVAVLVYALVAAQRAKERRKESGVARRAVMQLEDGMVNEAVES